MNLSLLRCIQNVQNFVQYKQELFYLTVDGDSFDNDNKIFDLAVSGKYRALRALGSRYLIWANYEGEVLIVDAETKKIIFESDGKSVFFNYYMISDSFLFNERKNGLNSPYFYNLKTQSIEQRHFDPACQLIGDSGELIFLDWGFNKSRDLCRIDSNNNVLWRYEISGTYLNLSKSEKERYFSRELGIYNDILWVLVAETDLIGLCVNTGKELHLIKAAKQLALDANSGELIGLHFDQLFRVNLNESDPVFERIDIASIMGVHDMSADFTDKLIHFEDQYIYFCDGDKGKVGVFDREKMEVVYSYSLEIAQGGVRLILDFKIDGDKWYIHDRRKVLHVLEFKKT